MCDDFDPSEDPDEEDEYSKPVDEEPALTPGERLLYALGQLYRLHHAGQLEVDPGAFDVENLARIIGVQADLEFAVEDRSGSHYHFPGEVICVEPSKPFPWRLLDVWEFAAEQNPRPPWWEDAWWA